MVYDIILPVHEGFSCEQDRYDEMTGATISHMFCRKEDSEITWQYDLYVGDLPSDTTPEDEAYANSAEIIGWDDEDDSEDPIAEWKFQNRKAYGFSGECEDGSIMLLMCLEIRKGVLVILCIIAPNDDEVGKLAKYIEEKLRVEEVK